MTALGGWENFYVIVGSSAGVPFGEGGLRGVDAYPALLAIAYQVVPELRRVVEAWQIRALLAAAGVLAAYVLVRVRWSCPLRGGSWRGASLRLVAGGIAAAGLWLGVDLVREEEFLAQLWAALPPQHENAVKGLVLVACGWAGWSVAVAELLRRVAVARQQQSASKA